MDLALNITADVDCMDNGTWSVTWSWLYIGENLLTDVHEEFLIVRPDDVVIDYRREETHWAESGETQIGGGPGNIQLPPGNYSWALNVINDGTVIGRKLGDFFAATVPDPVDPDPDPDPGGGGGGQPATGEVREPTLRRGDQSVDGWVEYLQDLLNHYKLGPLAIDGDFGGATHRAVVTFQDRRDLMVDGVVGNQTWASLRNETPQDPGTDGRKPHSYVEQGAEARWVTETGPAAYNVGDDSLVIPAVNTGSDPLGAGFVAKATLTPSGGTPVPLDLHSFTEDGQLSEPGEHVFFGNRGVAGLTGSGDVVVDALLPPELGSDNIRVTITVP